jgi:hypothetical protein
MRWAGLFSRGEFTERHKYKLQIIGKNHQNSNLAWIWLVWVFPEVRLLKAAGREWPGAQ